MKINKWQRYDTKIMQNYTDVREAFQEVWVKVNYTSQSL